MDQKTNHPVDRYFDVNKIPEEWFMPISQLNSEHCKQYMDPEGRAKTLKATYEEMLKSRKQLRGKK